MMSKPGLQPAGVQRRRVNTTRGSWLSLFAMLMIFIGPLLSQAMPMDHTMSMSMSNTMDMAEPGLHEPDHPGAHDQGSGELHVLWEKCGYCSLFVHCPALPQALSLITCDTPATSTCLDTQPLQGHAGQAVFPGARTRAPPPLAHV
jgi:hypothetical protein